MYDRWCVIGVGMALAVGAALGDAQGGLIRAPSAVLQNTGGEAGPTYVLANAYNQSGLSTGYTNGVTDFDTFIAGAPTHSLQFSGRAWLSSTNATSATIDFDMGAEYEITRIALWNEPTWGINTLVVKTSNTSDFSTSTSVGSFTPPETSSGQSYPVQVLDLTDTSARYVRFELTRQRPWYISMGEVAFDTGLAAVPEPSTLSALCGIVGMGLVGRWWRRRRHQR